MIGIIDYGMSNLGSVVNACAFLDLPCRILDSPDGAEDCRALLLPGQGAFGDCMGHLEEHGFTQLLRDWLQAGRPYLGICLGLQILFEGSDESPRTPGLGVLPGRVRRFDLPRTLKVPQMGWNRVRQAKDCPLYRDVPDESYFYFVHSFYADPADREAVAGETDYGSWYTSVVCRDAMMAVQFHPEKSQRAGLQLLKNFGHFAERGMEVHTA